MKNNPKDFGFSRRLQNIDGHGATAGALLAAYGFLSVVVLGPGMVAGIILWVASQYYRTARRNTLFAILGALVISVLQSIVFSFVEKYGSTLGNPEILAWKIFFVWIVPQVFYSGLIISKWHKGLYEKGI